MGPINKDSMKRITRLKVQKLFGIFDHEIVFNLEDRITIVHGPNGVGKTTLLSLLDTVFSSSDDRLFATQFESLVFSFDDGSSLEVSKEDMGISQIIVGKDYSWQKEVGGAAKVRFTFHDRDGVSNHFVRSQHRYKSSPNDVYDLVHKKLLETRANNLEMEAESSRIFASIVENMKDAGDLVANLQRRWDQRQKLSPKYSYSDTIPPTEDTDTPEPEWLTDARYAVRVILLDSQRFFDAAWSEQQSTDYSQSITRTLGSRAAKYAEVSEQLRLTFEERLKETSANESVDIAALQVRQKELKKKVGRLNQLGCLDFHAEQELASLWQDSMTDDGHRLSLLLKDLENALAAFDDVRDHLALFADILNARLLNKTVVLDQHFGAAFFQKATGTLLTVRDLSSGEKHLFAIFCVLLLCIDRGSLILIDEPELSLHVSWQVHFLADLARVTELAGLDVLLATHSPQIISDRWDLAVELAESEA